MYKLSKKAEQDFGGIFVIRILHQQMSHKSLIEH